MTIDVVRPRKAQAPTGKGLKTSPAIVEMKIDNNCHACDVTSGGFGTKNRTIRPIEIEIIKGISLAPWGFDSVTEFSSVDDEMGRIGLWVLVGFGKGLKRKGLGLKREEEKEWGDGDRREEMGFGEIEGGDLERDCERDRRCEETRWV